MSAISREFVILTEEGKVVVTVVGHSVGDDVVFALLEPQPVGTYWVLARYGYRGKQACRLTQNEHALDGEGGIHDAWVVLDTRIALDPRRYSERFRFSVAETQRPGLEAKAVPQAVIDAFIIAQVESFQDSIVF